MGLGSAEGFAISGAVSDAAGLPLQALQKPIVRTNKKTPGRSLPKALSMCLAGIKSHAPVAATVAAGFRRESIHISIVLAIGPTMNKA